MSDQKLRLPAENIYAAELEVLARNDDGDRPPNWRLSPKAVVMYILGGTAKDGSEISAKYIGSQRLLEPAVATLATDRALLLLGLPGTAKSWVSEHLAAAISGSSQRIIQCTAGTDENQVRYGWNYALLLAGGPGGGARGGAPRARAGGGGAGGRRGGRARMG